MAEILVTAIRTEKGDQRIDYNALANLPKPDTTLSQSGSFADAKAVGTKIEQTIQNFNTKIEETQSITINNKPLSENIVLTATDVGAAEEEHIHSAEDINSGTLSTDVVPVVPMSKGGTEAATGEDGLKNLLASGAMILSSNQYGPKLPEAGVTGRIFFLKAEVAK